MEILNVGLILGDIKTANVKDSITIDSTWHIVVIEDNNHKFDAQNSYKFALGTNFNFADGAQPQSLYAEISTFQPSVIKRKKVSKTFQSFGFYCGIYQNRYISSDSNAVNFTSMRTVKILNDTIAVRQKEEFTRKLQKNYNNLGLSWGILFNLYRTKQIDYEFNLFTCLHFEVIHQQVANLYNYETLLIDTFNLPIKLLPNRPDGIEKIKTTSETFNKSYVGIGFPIQVISQKVELFLRPVYGFTWISNEKKQLFYSYQFSIVEKKYGISLGGEFRGIFNSPDAYVAIYLSKLFDLSKLIEY